MIHIDQYRFGVAPFPPSPVCWEFNGTNERIEIGSAAEYDFEYTDPFSISAWIKASVTGNRIIFCRQSAFVNAGYHFRLFNGKMRFVLAQSGSIFLVADSTGTVHDGAWHHVVGTNDGSKTLKVYVDGSDVSTATTESGTVTTIANAVNQNIGSLTGGSNWYNGRIADLSVYNSTLTPTNVSDIYNSGNPVDETARANSVGYYGAWDSADGAGGIIDQVNSNNGTFSNMDVATNVITDYP